MMIYSGFIVPVHDPVVGFCNHGNVLAGSIESGKRFNQVRDYFLLRDSTPLNFDTSSLYFSTDIPKFYLKLMAAVMFITHTLFMNGVSRTWPKVEGDRQKVLLVLFTLCTRRMMPCGKRGLRSVKGLS